MEFKTGTLVEFRNRPWVVQQSVEKDMLVIKPLGGTDAEIIGLYRPLYGDSLDIKSYEFKRPLSKDLDKAGYQSAARILYNACRLSFRDIAGPFLCLGKLSFEPRPYQMVPLILALKQERIRLLISDDVGIGKTIESLLIAKELLDRHEIDRFAVVCLPHLCEQWQNEIKDKFGLNAEIIRSSTVSRLEKRLRNDQNVFRDIPFQVISIDYIKQRERMGVFLDHCPDLIIVDEAHTCARPTGTNKNQQQRYALLNALSSRGKQLILLTATPHSGQTEEFQSLIGLLDPKFEHYLLQTSAEREELSKYFVQRRRADINQYLGGEVVFPERVQIDGNDNFKYDKEYLGLLNDIINYVKEGIQRVKSADKRKQRYIYWDLLALMRGVMSSPDAGISMLSNKLGKNTDASIENIDDDDDKVYIFNDGLKDLLNADDTLPEALEVSGNNEKNQFKTFIQILEHIKETDADEKVKSVFGKVKIALDSGMNPIVFCQYIQTAEYVGKYITKHFESVKKYKNVSIGIITSRLSDEERKMKIDTLASTDKHVLVCTDCLSEGVNLQNGFESVIHYDLPWNPNRMEQRNGRIDRFGQKAPEVLISTMYAENNPVDDIVLNVLYKKQEEIKKQLGIYLPIADNDSSLMETIMQKILTAKTATQSKYTESSLFSDEEMEEDKKEQEIRIKRIAENEKISHTYFAHNNKQMDPTQLTESLKEARSVIGGVKDTRDFVVQELQFAGVTIKEDCPLCYSFLRQSLPVNLRHYFSNECSTIKISFLSPTPRGYTYIGRNHIFVEDLSRGVINDTINGGDMSASRAMVMETDKVTKITVILLMRVRSVIRDKRPMENEIVGEEMIFIGYRGDIQDHDFLSQDECKQLFLNAKASGSLDAVSQHNIYDRSVKWTYDEKTLRVHTDNIALERAQHLVTSFSRYRSYIKTEEYQVVEPVLPMDVIAAYVYIPTFKN